MNNAQEFLEYVAANEKRLKHNLKKNITYNDELFDDVFQTTVIKIYDSIIRQDICIDNFERYFFIGSKFEYINQDNKCKKIRNVTDDVSKTHCIIDDENEDHSEEIRKIYAETEDYLRYEYGDEEAEIYLSYYWNKVNSGRTSYRAVADEFNLSIEEVGDIIRKINADFRNKNIKLNNILYK